MINHTTNSITPAIFQSLCVLLKCSMLSHFFFRQAHSFPFAPRKKHHIKPKKGIHTRNAIQTLLTAPHIQVKANAPQFHPLISSGIIAKSPCPDVLSPLTPCTIASRRPHSGQNRVSSLSSFPQLGQNGIASHVLLIHHTRTRKGSQ